MNDVKNTTAESMRDAFVWIKVSCDSRHERDGKMDTDMQTGRPESIPVDAPIEKPESMFQQRRETVHAQTRGLSAAEMAPQLTEAVRKHREAAIQNELNNAEPPAPEPASAMDRQEGGSHYKDMGAYQPWEVLQRWLTPEEYRGYMKGTAIAYLAREQGKGGDLDIRKSAHTLEGLIEVLAQQG